MKSSDTHTRVYPFESFPWIQLLMKHAYIVIEKEFMQITVKRGGMRGSTILIFPLNIVNFDLKKR